MKTLSWPSWLSRDVKLIFVATGIRSFSYGFLAVILGVYFSQSNISAFQTGLLLTAAMAGGALSNFAVLLRGDAVGRRRMLIFLALLMTAGGALFSSTTTISVMALAALLGVMSTSGRDRGGLVSIEQPILTQACPDAMRTTAFGYYNFVQGAAQALGALFSGFPVLVQSVWGVEVLPSFRVMFGIYAALGLAAAVIYTRLSEAVEVAPGMGRSTILPKMRSGSVVWRLSALFGLDSFGGGLAVQSFISYWFFDHYGVGLEALGFMFFVSYGLNALSYVVAVRLAKRFGLINTMVFSHIPSNLLLIVLPLVPVLWAAVGIFLAREFLTEMDVPTRQSYLMGVIPPEDRTAASGTTNLARNVPLTVSPTLGGYIAQTAFLGAPLVAAGVIKIVYDLLLFFSFRRLKTPEERELTSKYGTLPPDREADLP